jgi:hypothetical protein
MTPPARTITESRDASESSRNRSSDSRASSSARFIAVTSVSTPRTLRRPPWSVVSRATLESHTTAPVVPRARYVTRAAPRASTSSSEARKASRSSGWTICVLQKSGSATMSIGS